MELVHEFVGIGPHGIHHVPHAGEVVGQPGHLSPVAEDAHRPCQSAVFIQGQAVSQHPHVLEGLHAHVVLRPPGAQNAVQGGRGVDGVEGAAHGGLRRQGEHLGCGGVEKDDTPFPVDGQNPLLQGLQNVLPLVEAPGEGVWFVAHQGALDAPGQPQGQQGPHCRRQRTDGRQAQGGGQRHMGQAAQVEPHGHKADYRPGFVPDGGVGRVVGAHWTAVVKGIGLRPCQGAGLGGASVAAADKAAVWRIAEHAFRVSHQNQIDIRGAGGGRVQKVGQLVCGYLPQQGLPHEGHLGENGCGVKQILVQGLPLGPQGDVEGAGQGKGHRDGDDNQAQPHELGADGTPGLVGHGQCASFFPVGISIR